MGSPAAYAKVVPRLRILKASLLGSRAKELGPTLTEAMGMLRDTVYSQAAEAKDPRAAEAALARAFFSAVDSLEHMAPEEAAGVVTVVARAQEAKDLAAMARALAEGSQLPSWLPSFEWSRSPLSRLAEDLSVSPTLGRLADIAPSYGDLGKLITEAVELYGELKDPAAFTWHSLVATARTYTDAINSVPRVDVDPVERSLCPLLEEAAALGLLEAWGARVPPRLVEEAYSDLKACRLPWNSMAASYERSLGGEAMALAQEVSGYFRFVRLEGRTLSDLMQSARRTARIAAQRAAEAIFSAYPFTAGLVAAAAVLLYIDYENVRTALLSLMMSLQPEEFQAYLI